ncbi:MAG: hypothetical protein AAF658_03670 [Myxococcota bacterium]
MKYSYVVIALALSVACCPEWGPWPSCGDVSETTSRPLDAEPRFPGTAPADQALATLNNLERLVLETPPGSACALPSPLAVEFSLDAQEALVSHTDVIVDPEEGDADCWPLQSESQTRIAVQTALRGTVTGVPFSSPVWVGSSPEVIAATVWESEALIEALTTALDGPTDEIDSASFNLVFWSEGDYWASVSLRLNVDGDTQFCDWSVTTAPTP